MKENTQLIINRILSILSGVIAGVIIISIFELISNKMFPLPEGFDFKDKEAFKVHLDSLPSAAFALVLIGHGIGALVGGFVASKMGKVQKRSGALFVGLILMFAALLNLLSIPHPLWFSIINVLIYYPMAFLGYYIYTQIIEQK